MATFAETVLSKYETLLQTGAGLDTVSVDDQSVRYADVEAGQWCPFWQSATHRASPTS